jgi:hypothetical protein
MFERYTEKARRAIFFSRYEASQFGSGYIETEHLLLGLIRENKSLHRWMPKTTPEAIRKRVEARTSKAEPMATSVDLPLSPESKRVLKLALDEADRLAHRHIGTEHLFLGILGMEGCFAAQLLREAGADAANIRVQVAQPDWQSGELVHAFRSTRLRVPSELAIEIHGRKRNADYIRDVVSTIRSYNWHWHKAEFKPRDMVIHRKTGQFSLDLSLAQDTENFIFVQQGWTKDHCVICRWELHESDDEHGRGYTNGRSWLCIECCERFVLRPDFFSSSHSEIT